MKRLLYIMIVLFAFNQVNGQQVRRVKEASKMTAVTDTSDVDKTAGKMYVYDDKYWVGHGTGLRQMSTGVSASGVYVEIEDSTAANKGYYATFKSVEDSAAQLRADLLAPPVLLSQGGTGIALADGTAGQVPRSTGLGTVGWSTATYPHTVSANELMYGSGANVFGTLSTLNHALLQTDGSGTPAWWTPTASRVLQTDASGDLSSSAITTTELGYLDNASSEIQGQLNGKMDDLVDDTTPQLGADLDGQGYYALDLQNIPDLAASGPGLFFDGSNDVVTITDNADTDFGTGDFTLQFNVYFPSDAIFNSNKALYRCQSTTGIILHWSALNTLRLQIENVSDAATNTVLGITTDKHYNLTFVRDDDDILIYNKGILKDTFTGYSEKSATAATGVLLGYGAGADRYLNMELSSVRAFNLILDNTDATDKAIINGGDIPYKYLGASQTIVSTYDSSAVDDVTITIVGDKHYTWTAGSADSLMLDLVKATSDTTFVFDGTSDVRAKGDLTGSNLLHTGNVAQYESDGIGWNQWRDKSGNELHGAVSGAIPINLPSTHTEVYEVTVTGETTFTLKKGYAIEMIVIKNTTANLVTNLDFGFSDAGGEIIAAANFAASGEASMTLLQTIDDFDADDTVYISSGNWNSASLDCKILMRRMILN